MKYTCCDLAKVFDHSLLHSAMADQEPQSVPLELPALRSLLGLEEDEPTAKLPVMSLQEIKESVLALPERERHEFIVWINRLEGYGDVNPEAVAQIVAEVWDEEDRHTHARPDSSSR